MSDGFDQPHEISDIQLAFPAQVVGVLMPDRADVPESYPDRGLWEDFVSQWFFFGNPFSKYDIGTREGVDGNKAIRHASAILKSFEPKHEHKTEATAWLLSRWFDGIVLKEAAS